MNHVIRALSILTFFIISQQAMSADVESLEQRTNKAEELMYTYFGDDSVLDEAGKLLQSVLKDNNEYVPALVQLSRLTRKVHDNKKGYILAKRLLEKAESLDQNYPEIYVQKYFLAINVEGDWEAASKAKQRYMLLTNNETDPWINIDSAKQALASDQIDTAESLLLDVLKYPLGTEKSRMAHMNALVTLGTIAYQKSENDKLMSYTQSMENLAHPKDAWSFGNHANTLCRAGMIDKGIEFSRKALSIMKYRNAEEKLAFCLYAKSAELLYNGDEAGSQKYYDEAYKINTDASGVVNDFYKTDIDKYREPFLDKYIMVKQTISKCIPKSGDGVQLECPK